MTHLAAKASAHQDADTGASLDALNGCCVGAALVNGDLLWHVVQVDRPAMNGGVVNEDTPLLHHLLHVSQAQRVGHVPSHASQHHFQRVVGPFENFA